ncbi:MarR family winged helix-turn-helix transcriptional regulator [Intrasporangium flavum]|uniref:MarR family winged helix-turn-helix transcriptional regulator n=1 Tax=Intrasporangium flavum TaxID=1428657 RepID=UPI00096FD711|nr:MarR family transcriptional regulator [Intrasporangium flavum]
MTRRSSAGSDAELVLAVKRAVSRFYTRIRSERPPGDLGDGALEVLARVEKYGPFSLTDLSDFYRVTPASMSQTVNRLTSSGYAERVRDAADGRRVLIAATEEGARLSVAARGQRDAWISGHLGVLDDADREVLRRASELLLRMADARE